MLTFIGAASVLACVTLGTSASPVVTPGPVMCGLGEWLEQRNSRNSERTCAAARDADHTGVYRANEWSRSMSTPHMSRRDVLLQGSVAIAGLALLRAPGLAYAFSAQPGEEVLPWLDQPAPNPVPDVVGTQLKWEALDSWLTPNDQFFTVGHYDKPVLDAAAWRLQIGGLVQQPMTLTLDDLKARPRQEVTFTLECSGNDGLPFLTGAVGNATWAGTPLAPLLQEAGVLDQGIEVVFFGSDTGVEDVRDIKMPQHFARSMSVADAMDPHNLLCYEMNGEPLPQMHGVPAALDRPRLVRDRQRQVAAAHRGAADSL